MWIPSKVRREYALIAVAALALGAGGVAQAGRRSGRPRPR